MPQPNLAAIWSAHARVGDKTAMRHLTAPLPDDIAAQVRELARPAMIGRGGMRYSAALSRAYFLQHDADGVLSCFTFENICSLKQGAELLTAIDDGIRAGGMDMDGVRAAYTAVTGIPLESIDVRH